MEQSLICCPQFNPSVWDEKIFEWDNKRFIKSEVKTFMYMPFNFGKVMENFQEQVEAGGAKMSPDAMCLSDHTSKWSMNVYLAVDKEVDGAENISLSGKYFSKVYEGPYSQTGKWTADFEKTAKTKGFIPKKMFMWYAYCPKCAKKYGKISLVS